MDVSQADWIKYKDELAAISEKAAQNLETWLTWKGGYQNVSKKDLIDMAYALATRYGEATASLAAEMYDETAALSGVSVPSAEVADTASYGEIAKAINGVTKTVTTDSNLGNVVARYVKRAGADTTLKNAERDGAQFAWIPAGDTCAFCLTLASNGWQYQSKNAMKNGHASHIHANCDCTYAVRFDNKTNVKGYNPEKYREMYYNAEGKTPQERINSMRRIHYQENRDKILAQKKANYEAKKELNNNILKSLNSGKNRSIMQIDTGGKRNEKPLTPEQIKECKDYAVLLGMPKDRIAYSDIYHTSYGSMPDVLLLGTDAYPNPDSTDINGRLSAKSAIAHEIVGHRESILRGKTNFPVNDPRDEAQASIRAARFAPGLSEKERYELIHDAINRLHKAGIKIRDVKDILDINER